MIQGVANQGVGAQMVNATTGGAYVGTVTVYVTLNPPVGVQVIGSVGGGICQSEGNGYYSYAPSVQETNAAFIAFTFVGTGAIPATIQVATISPSQQAALSIAGQPAAVACSAIITAALFEIRVARAGDVPAFSTAGVHEDNCTTGSICYFVRLCYHYVWINWCPIMPNNHCLAFRDICNPAI